MERIILRQDKEIDEIKPNKNIETIRTATF